MVIMSTFYFLYLWCWLRVKMTWKHNIIKTYRLDFSLTNYFHLHDCRSFSYGSSSRLESLQPWNSSTSIKVLDDLELEGVRALLDASCWICLISYNSYAIDFSRWWDKHCILQLIHVLLLIILYVLPRFGWSHWVLSLNSNYVCCASKQQRQPYGNLESGLYYSPKGYKLHNIYPLYLSKLIIWVGLIIFS